MRLAAGKEGVHNGRAHCGIVVAAEEVVLSAQGQRPDGILHAVVVDVVSAVKDIAAQSRKEGVCVNQGHSYSGPGSEAAGNGVHPFLKVPDDGISLIFSSFPDRIRLEPGLFHIGFIDWNPISRTHTLEQMLEEIGEPVYRWKRKEVVE